VKLFRTIFLLTFLIFPASNVLSQVFDEKFEHWPVNLKINGTVIASNSLKNSAETDSIFLKLNKGKEAKTTIIFLDKLNADREKELKEIIGKPKSINVISPELKKLPQELIEEIKEASAVIINSGEKISANSRDKILSLKNELVDLLKRSGTLYTEGQVAVLLSNLFSNQNGEVKKGLDLIPDSVIEVSHSTKIDDSTVKGIIKKHPRKIGITIEKDTSLILSGRKLFVLGGGSATLYMAANKVEALKVKKISTQKFVRQSPKEFLVDLTQWRREAIDRTIEPFPPAEPKAPFVENGTLVIVGGGGMPKNLMKQFIDFAGGPEKAKLVYVPCSEAEVLPDQQRTVNMWKKMGVKNATFIHTKDRNKANSDEEFMAPLKDATGIWFGGGRQWNMADSYYGTQTHKLMKEVLKRGGVIGGSSAGASIQARYLARATPIQNFDIMAPGYERGGLGFISGVAIDQHFSERKRQKDMTQLVNKYPQMLGIGIDEATALIVQKSKAKIAGKGKVYFYNRKIPVVANQADYTALPDGSEYDLKERKVLKDSNK